MTVQAIAKIIRETVDADMSQRLHKVDEAATAILALLSALQDRDVGGDWRFTPMEVEMLLHLYAIAEPLPRMFATVREAALQSFIERGFVRPSKSSGSGYRTTKLGERVVNAICNPSTPPSVAVIPDGVRNALEQAKDRLEAVQRHQDFGARLPSVQAALVQVRAALIPLSASPSPALDGAKENLDARYERLVEEASNLGYVLTPEPPHPDCPHVQTEERNRIAIKDEAREEAMRAMPCTAENPNESEYERGKFDGVLAFARAILALKGQP